MTASESPAQLRARLLKQRRALPPKQISALSQQVVERFITQCGIPSSQWKGRRVALYRALPGELDPSALGSALIGLGAQLCFPRILDPAASLMDFVESPSEDGWQIGPYGIQQPAIGLPAVAPAALDVFFVPGVAFGLQGERLGMGAGYYDRYLVAAPRALKVALAFDFQLLPKLEQQPWDQPVDWVWTERREVRLRAWP